MTTWADLDAYVRQTYQFEEIEPGWLRVSIHLEVGREQLVFIEHQQLHAGKEDWVQISAPIAGIDEVDLRQLLVESGSTVCGGVVAVGEQLMFRHAVPLATLDGVEFDRPLQLVLDTADTLQDIFRGDDPY